MMAAKTITARAEVLIRYVKLADRLVSENDEGKLPSVTWLRRHGHAGLYLYMRAHPKPFQHIEQDIAGRRGKRTYDHKVRDRHVAKAKALARKNGGVLPSVTWLVNHNHKSMLSYMWKHPRFFEDIPREKNKKSPEEHVKDAEDFAKKCGGALPGSWTIINRKGWALYQFMRRNPELFGHIPKSSCYHLASGN